jgi:NAD(P)-dependent dehydrogenase (short-subunit alcohol dehydrogenase family)
MTGTPTSDPDRSGGGTVDSSHLLLVGAGPGLGMAVARRFAVGGYRVTLVARNTDKLGDLAGSLSDTGADIVTIEADASDPEGLGARLTELHRGQGAPGVIIYNAVMGAVGWCRRWRGRQGRRSPELARLGRLAHAKRSGRPARPISRPRRRLS